MAARSAISVVESLAAAVEELRVWPWSEREEAQDPDFDPEPDPQDGAPMALNMDQSEQPTLEPRPPQLLDLLGQLQERSRLHRSP